MTFYATRALPATSSLQHRLETRPPLLVTLSGTTHANEEWRITGVLLLDDCPERLLEALVMRGLKLLGLYNFSHYTMTREQGERPLSDIHERRRVLHGASFVMAANGEQPYRRSKRDVRVYRLSHREPAGSCMCPPRFVGKLAYTLDKEDSNARS